MPESVTAKRWYLFQLQRRRPSPFDEVERGRIDGVDDFLPLTDVGVREDDDRRLVSLRDVEGVDRGRKFVPDGCRRQHRADDVPMRREDGLEQIRLLAFGGDAGRGATALHVHAHQGQLGDGRELRLERHSRTGRRGFPQTSAATAETPAISSSAWMPGRIPNLPAEVVHDLVDGVAINLSRASARARARAGGRGRAGARRGRARARACGWPAKKMARGAGNGRLSAACLWLRCRWIW